MLIYLVIIAGIVLTVIGLIFIKPIAALLGEEGNILNDCITYERVLLITLIAFLLQNCFQSFLVVAEKPQMGLMISISYIISELNIFSSAFFTALNNGVVSAVISFMRTFVFQVAMILILPMIWGLNGVWIAVVFAEILALVVSIVFLILNKKKYQYT